MTSRAEYLTQRLAELNRHTGDQDNRWNDEDVEDLGLEVAEFLRDGLDVPSLERELVGRSQLDTAAILSLAGSLEALGKLEPPPFQLELGLGTGTYIDWRSRLEGLRNVAGSLETPEKLENLEVVLRLNLVADGAVDTLLAALPSDHPLKADIERRLSEKLALLSDDKAMEFWAQLRFQVDPSRDVHFDLDADAAPKEFLDLGDAAQVRVRIARYLAILRPALERRMVEKGIDRVPGGLVGIPSILSWTKTPSTTEWTATQRTSIRSLGRLALLWTGDKNELAKALGVLSEGYFLGGRGEQEAKRSLESGSHREERRRGRLLDELMKLVRIAEQSRVRIQGTVERALRAFKLGHEVVAEDVFGDPRTRNEMYLQRKLVRFLVERDIPAYGTKFGRSEVDVRAEDPLGAIVVETKVLRGPLSERSLNRWLTQLASYMDQAHVALRGALVIFNYGTAPILCPVVAVRFNYLIVAINLCEASPSKRQASVEIEEARSGENIVRLVRFGEEPKSPTPATRKRPHKKMTRTRRNAK